MLKRIDHPYSANLIVLDETEIELLRQVANGELVPAPVKCGECANKPFCECVINNHYEDDDFCSYGERKDGEPHA